MNKTMIFTVQMPEHSNKPVIYAQMATSAHRDKQELAENLIRDWLKIADIMIHNWFELDYDFNITEKDIEDLAYNMRKEGYAWWNEEICFELTEVVG